MNRQHHGREETAHEIAGVRVGIVRDNEDPENLGRVKLEFPWRDADDESYWARIATEMTGDGYGTYFLPEVEDEVLVGFENGDIHSPIVIGSLWSGNRKPPEDNADGNNDVRKIETRSGHVVEFDDNDQEGAVRIETAAGHTVVLDDASGSESVAIEDKAGNSLEMDSNAGEVAIEANTELSLSAPTIELSADGELTVDSSGTLEMSGDAQTKVSSKGQLNVESTGIMGIDASGPLQIQGAIIQLN